MSQQLPPPGWYPDAERPGGERFWDGQLWTEHRRAVGAPAFPPPHQGTKPDPWLWQSIVATLLCCLPFGVAGIVFAAQSTTAWDHGRAAEAQEKAAKAKMFTLISVGAAALAIVAWLVFTFFIIAASEMQA